MKEKSTDASRCNIEILIQLFCFKLCELPKHLTHIEQRSNEAIASYCIKLNSSCHFPNCIFTQKIPYNEIPLFTGFGFKDEWEKYNPSPLLIKIDLWYRLKSL